MGSFFPDTKNPFPELVEGNMFAKRCRHFDRLRDRVAVQVVCLAKMCRSLRLSKGRVCKEVTALRQAQGPGCFTYNDFCYGFKTEKAPSELETFLVRLV